MRASDRDRERVTEILSDAYTVGRLSHEEFLERTDAAWSAKTRGQLDGVTSDLPESRRLVRAGTDAETPGRSVKR